MDESQQSVPATPVVIPPAGSRGGGRHRLPAPPHAVRGRAAVLAVAAGAAVSAASAGSALDADPTHSAEAGDIALLANGEATPDTSAPATTSSPTAVATPSQPEPVAMASAEDGTDEVAATMLFAGTEINTKREIAEEQERRPDVVIPAEGTFTSGFGPRWGAFHAGIDIANANGTPILAATDGTVIDSGPAQGYGNWIRIMSDDGTMTVYGHMDSLDVGVGERVVAGQKIAGMGNLGFSTGTHLHFEVHEHDQPIDPLIWLARHGLALPGAGGSADLLGSLGSD